MDVVYLNGEYLPIAEAKVSVMDRGFLFADGVYEVVTVYHGKLFRAKEHLKRLHHSLDAVGISLPISDAECIDIFEELIDKNIKEPIETIYMQVTRGSAPQRKHVISEPIKPTIFVRCQLVKKRQERQGIKTITVQDIRWKRCDIKGTNRLANVLMSQQAFEVGADEAIIVDDQQVIEGATSNIFIVKDHTIYTPPHSNRLLAGVIRDLIVELANKHQLNLKEIPISLDDCFKADEVWVTSSSREITPVTKIDDKLIGNGSPGSMYEMMIKFYYEYIESLR